MESLIKPALGTRSPARVSGVSPFVTLPSISSLLPSLHFFVLFTLPSAFSAALLFLWSLWLLLVFLPCFIFLCIASVSLPASHGFALMCFLCSLASLHSLMLCCASAHFLFYSCLSLLFSLLPSFGNIS